MGGERQRRPPTPAIGMRSALLFASSLLVAFVARAGEMLANPDLEQGLRDGKAIGWLYEGRKCAAGSGFGRNYSHGLRYKGDGGPYEWVYQNVAIEEGRLYRYEGWLKCEGLTGKGGARLFVACYRANGKWCESTDGLPITGTSDGWVHLSLDLVPKRGAVKAEVCVKMDDGETGTVWMDELSFSPVARPPIRLLVSDAYRDTASEGEVTFRLVSNLTNEEIARRKWTGVFRLPDPSAAGFFREHPASAFTNGVSVFTVDAGRLPFGEIPVSFAFRDEKGRSVATETMTFSHPKTRPARRVEIDARGRMVVDGKPFFPLGIFMDGLGGDRAKRVAEGPFNCVLPYEMVTRQQLDWARRNGLKVIYCLKNLYRGFCFQPFPMVDAAEESAFVAARVAAIRDHPALLAWYLADEMGVGMVPRMRERARLVRRFDPDHPTYGCSCSPESILEYLDTADVVGTDPYPLGSAKNPSLGRCTAETETVRSAYWATRPIWQVTQAFDPSYISKDKGHLHHPTRDEMVNMNLQCVAAGANGILLWSYAWLDRNALGKSEELFERNWKAVREAGTILREMLPVFLAEDVSELVEGRKPDMPVRAWRHGGRICVLAVNATRESRTETISVCGRPHEFSFAPLGHALRRFDPDGR